MHATMDGHRRPNRERTTEGQPDWEARRERTRSWCCNMKRCAKVVPKYAPPRLNVRSEQHSIPSARTMDITVYAPLCSKALCMPCTCRKAGTIDAASSGRLRKVNILTLGAPYLDHAVACRKSLSLLSNMKNAIHRGGPPDVSLSERAQPCTILCSPSIMH